MNLIKSDIDFFLSENEKKPIRQPIELISEYIQEKRILPPGTPFPGFWNNGRTPYLIEIMDNMSPHSSVQHVVVMKGAQLGLTANAENVIAYWIDESPAEILFISATGNLLEKWATKRLEPLIDSCGLRGKFAAQTENVHTRRTGDKTFVKEFPGGALDMASAQSAASLRADAKRVLIRDEIDGAPLLLRTHEGNWLNVSYARTNAWGARRKVLDFSTPTTFEDSAIYKEYLAGDERRFFVPCPYCGEMQILEWQNIKPETHAGRVENVYYECSKCTEPIRNHHKTEMLRNGKWIATSQSHSKYYRSYQLSTLYSPIGMLDWLELWGLWIRAQEENDLQSFTNLYLGMPYREKGSRPKLENVIELRGNYKSRSVPYGVLFLTAGADVQRGSEKNPNENPARIEIEICGHGLGYRTWSIAYEIFYGDVSDAYAGAWEEFYEFIKAGKLNYFRGDNYAFTPELGFIDSGDGNITHVVYEFCSRLQRWFYPCKGDSMIKARKGEKSDIAGFKSMKRFRATRLDQDLTLYTLSTEHYKNIIYRNLKIQRKDEDIQRPGFCDFPSDYPEKFFKMLVAEEKKSDGSFDSGGRRNEALDCFDSETEVLTDQGWKYFIDLDKTEKVATVNLEQDIIEYQSPVDYIQRYHSGEMIHIKGTRLDILVTPRHRMIASKKKQEVIGHNPYRRKWNLNTPFEFILAQNLTIHHQLKNSSNWKKEIKDFIIPELRKSNGQLVADEKKIDALTWAAFLGFYIAEGSKFKHYHNGRGSWAHRVQLDQKEGETSDKLRKLLKKLPWNFNESKNHDCFRWICTQKQLYKAVEDCGANVYKKKCPEWIKLQDMTVIQTFLRWAIMGDGHVQKEGHRSYYTVSKQLADDIQELFIKSGTSARIDFIKPKPYTNFANSKNYNGGKNVKTQYHIRESRYKKKSIDGGGNGKRECLAKSIQWDGLVFCVSVPNETLILRRKGISFIAGNCRVYNLGAADVYLDSAVKLYIAGEQAKGVHPAVLQQINSRTILDYLAAKTQPKKPVMNPDRKFDRKKKK